MFNVDSKTLIPVKCSRLADSSESFLWNRMSSRSCWLIVWSILTAPVLSLFPLIAELFLCFLNFKHMSETELDVCSLMDSTLSKHRKIIPASWQPGTWHHCFIPISEVVIVLHLIHQPLASPRYRIHKSQKSPYVTLLHKRCIRCWVFMG